MFSRCASCWLLVMIIQALVLNIAQAQESSDWKYWKLQLSAPAPADRARAAFELAKLGPQAEGAMDELFVCLTDGHPQVRLQAAQALGYLALRTNEAIPHLLLLLDDSDEHVRYASEWAIARLAITPVDQHEIASRLADLRRAVELMRSRTHHARHRQVIEQAIGQLEELATPSVAVEPPVELNQQQIERQRILAQLESLRARFFLGDVMERLAMIELLCEAYQDPELERARRSVQVDLIDQAYRRSDLAVLKYAESFWGSEVADSARSRLLPSVLRMSETPDWIALLLSDCRPGSEAEILALTDIALDIRHNILLRCAALECLSQSSGEPPASCIAAVCSIAGNQPCEPRVRLAAIETLGLLLESSPSSSPLPALEKLLLDPNEDWELRLACLEVFAALRQQPVEPATQFFQQVLQEELGTEDLLQLFDCLEQIRYLPLAATPLIEQSLQSSRLTLRVAAIQCLKAHDTSLVETELLPLLLERFQDPYEAPAVLSAAASLLSSFPNENIGSLAKQLAGLPEPSLSNTMWALADSSPGSPLSLETVKSLIEKPQLSLSARCGATLALRGMSDSNESMMRLLSQLQGNQDEASLRACQILVLSQSPTADQALAERSAPEDSVLLRACGAYSDAISGDPAGAEALIPLLVASPHRLDASPGSDAPDYAANELARALLLELGNDAILPLQSVIARQELPPALRAQALEVLLAIPQDDYGYLLGWIGDPVVGQICEQSFLLKTPTTESVEGLRLLFQLHRACDAPSLRYRYQKLAEQVVATFSTGNEAATPDRRSSSLVRLLHAQMSGDTFLRPVNADLLAGSNFELLDTSDSGRFHSAVHPFDIPVASASEAPSFEAVDTLTATPQFAAQMQSFGALPRGAQPPSAIRQAATEVNVFYGTNRRMNWDVLPHLPSVSRVGFSIMWPLSLGTLVAAALWMFLRSGRSTFLPLSMAAVAGLLAMTAAFRANDTAVRRLGQPAAYAGEFADGISFGVCRVSIPPKHLPGELEGPSIFRLEIREDDQEHIVLKSTTELESRDFFRELDTEMLSKGRNLLVFIHGYNVSFEDAARRTAQLVHDLEFPGAPVCYSWPSQSSWYQYRQDQENIRRSVPHIKQFLLQLAQRTRADSIHLIAHSMGSVGLTEALADMSPTPSPRFQQVVLAAPDINAESFRTEIVPKITGKAKRFTMYVSSSDLALLASRYFNAGWRVGELLNLHDIPFIDVIDSSAVDTSLLGHSYYGQLSVLSDLAELLMDQPLEERTNIQKRVHNGVAQTVFRIPRIAGAEDQQAVSR